MLPTLDIIIVNWNSGDFLFECITSIFESEKDEIIINSIIIVDNASSDNSLNKIENINLPIKIIKNSENLGFGKACNIGAKNSNSDFLLMLNPDAKVFNNSLSSPVLFLNQLENQEIGIVGVKIIDENNKVSRNCARFPTPISIIASTIGLDKIYPRVFNPHFLEEWDHLDSRYVDQVMGSFLLIRKNLFVDLNGYDDRFFVYYEDLDLSLRAKNMGYKSYYLSTSSIYHKGGGTTEKVKSQRLFYNQHSKLQYSKKHFSFYKNIFVAFFVLFIEPITRSLYSLSKGSFVSIGEIIIGYKELYKVYLGLR